MSAAANGSQETADSRQPAPVGQWPGGQKWRVPLARSILMPVLLFAGTFGAVWYDQHATFRRVHEALSRRVDAVEMSVRHAKIAEPRLEQSQDERAQVARELERLTAAVPPRLEIHEFLRALGRGAERNAVLVEVVGKPAIGSLGAARLAGIDVRLLGSRDAIGRTVEPVTLPRLAVWCRGAAGESWAEGRLSILALPEPLGPSQPVDATTPAVPPGLLWPWPYGARTRVLRARLAVNLDALAARREVAQDVEQFKLDLSRVKRVIETVRLLRRELVESEGACFANFPSGAEELP